MELMTTDLIARARAGDGDAFETLIEPYRRGLRLHCYRMMGSLHDAEDALQETLLAAWRGLAAYEGRASIRTWLYRIATTRCLNTLRSVKRRSAKEWDTPDFEPPTPTRLNEIVWLEPYPDALLRGMVDAAAGPDARYEQTEAISLAFVTALQTLSARQRAVLILRDVLAYQSTEVAEMLETTVESVNSLLKRARATMRNRSAAHGDGEPTLVPNSPGEKAIIDEFVRAFESGDVDALVALFTDDVRLAMPPIALEYQGRESVARFFAAPKSQGPRYHLVQTRANGQLAFASYLRAPAGEIRRASGIIVVTLRGQKVCDIVRFDETVLPWFELPPTLPRL